MSFCCEKCFVNEHIIKYIKSKNQSGKCSFCGAENVNVLSFVDMGNYIIDCILKAYEDLEEGTGAEYDWGSHCYYDGSGKFPKIYSVREILNNETCFSDFAKKGDLLDKIVEDYITSTGDPKNFFKTFSVDEQILVIKNDLTWREDSPYFRSWEEFKDIISYDYRFFDVDKDNSRQQLLDSLKPILEKHESVVQSNTSFFRSRKCSENFLGCGFVSNKNSELGPPPPKFTSNMRMSPIGISYLYVATDINTTLAEVNANVKDKVAMVEFNSTKDLRVLDFTKDVIIPMDSIFKEDYNHFQCWANNFLSDFIEEISKPVNANASAFEYLATQLLSEYIRYLGYDGICYSSSKSTGKNYVFFCGPVDRDKKAVTRIKGFTEWFEIVNYQDLLVRKKEMLTKEMSCKVDWDTYYWMRFNGYKYEWVDSDSYEV